MMSTIHELYEQAIRPLPSAERLQLATLILNDIPPQSMVDYREEWTEEDYADFRQAGWSQIDAALEEADDG